MATVNKRLRHGQAMVVNGVDAGGLMTATLTTGYDQRLRSSPDGLEGPALQDKYIEYCRGTIVTQDWIEFVNLLTGAVGTKVFYERKSGVAAATGYVKHTITAPVIHRANISVAQDRYATCSFDFECLAADETKGIDDYWTQLDEQTAPTHITAARGGYRIAAAAFDTALDAIDIYHVTGFDFSIAMNLLKASNDGDVGYTCVEAIAEALSATGSIRFQDATISATPEIKLQELLTHAADQLVLTITQSQGAAAKTVTLLGVDFNDGSFNSDVNSEFTEYTLNFEIVNDTTTQLTLAGDNKIISIA